MTGVLRAMRSDDPAALLADDTDAPVWPIHDRAAEARVHAIARLFDLDVEYVAGVRATGRTPGPGAVVGVGPTTRRAAELYAHLTRRRCVEIDGPTRELPVDAEIVVVPLALLSAELLARVYAHGGPAGCVGLVTAATEAAMVQQVLTRALGGVRAAPNRGEVHVWPEAKVATAATRTGRVVGRLATARELADALGSARAVHLETHSDGLCASLGDEVLCPILGAPEAAAPAPPCVASGSCHRRGTPLAQALDDPTLLGTDAIAAPVLIASACWGVVSSPFLWNAEWSLGQRMIDHPRIAALLAPWELFFRDRVSEGPLRLAILDGAPLGEVLAHQRTAELELRRGYRWALFGDPRLRLRPGLGLGVPGRTGAPAMHGDCGAEPTSISARTRGFLSCLLDSPKLAEQRDRTEIAAERVRAALVVDADGADATTDRAELRLETATLRLITAFDGAFAHLWIGGAGLHVTSDDRRCPVCDGHARGYTSTPGPRLDHRRRLLVCTRCGIVEDADIEAPTIAARLEHETVEFVGLDEQRPWALAVKRTTLRAGETDVELHVLAAHASRVVLPHGHPRGLHFFQFALFTSAGITSLWHPVTDDTNHR